MCNLTHCDEQYNNNTVYCTIILASYTHSTHSTSQEWSLAVPISLQTLAKLSHLMLAIVM